MTDEQEVVDTLTRFLDDRRLSYEVHRPIEAYGVDVETRRDYLCDIAIDVPNERDILIEAKGNEPRGVDTQRAVGQAIAYDCLTQESVLPYVCIPRSDLLEEHYLVAARASVGLLSADPNPPPDRDLIEHHPVGSYFWLENVL